MHVLETSFLGGHELEGRGKRMTKRGRILRDTNAGPGLVTVEGKQYSFTLEDMWTSQVPPRPGMVVDVLFGSEGNPSSLRAVPDKDIAKEQAQQALSEAKVHGSVLASKLRSRFGVPLLIVMAVLVVGWFFLNGVSMGGSRVQFTFWQMLGYLGNAQALVRSLDSNEAPGSGIYGFLAVLSLAAPFLRFFWHDRRASLAGWLPLLLMVLVAFEIHSGLRHAFDTVYPWGGAGAQRDHAWQMFMDNIGLSYGAGTWISLAASVYLAWVGTRQFFSHQVSLADTEFGKVETSA